MAANTITYSDKIQGADSGYPTNEIFSYTDANLIKSVVNNHASLIDTAESAIDVNENDILELQTSDAYNPTGWGYYQDGETTPATLTINTTPSLLLIDSAGADTDEDYLPLVIRGSDSLWISNKISPISIGDSYNIRIDLEITGKTGSPSNIYAKVDIGGDVTPTIVLIEQPVNVSKSSYPYTIPININLFAKTTFNTNGGQIFLSTDTGSLTVALRGIFINRTHSGAL